MKDLASEHDSPDDTQMADDDGREPKEEPKEEEPKMTPHTTAKDRTLQEFLGMMDQFAPIVRSLCKGQTLVSRFTMYMVVTDRL